MTVAPTPIEGGRAPGRRPLAVVAAFALVAIGIGIGLLLDHGSSSSTTRGSGVPAQQTRSVRPFTNVELAGTNVVHVTVGEKRSVVVHADDNLLDTITTEVHNGSLVVGNTSGSIDSKSPMSVEVGVPSLDTLVLSGSGILDVSGLRPSRLTVKLPGSGVIRASGNASSLDVDLAGSGDAQLGELTAADVRAVVGGSGRIVVTATKSLHASVPGSGAIFYRGSPSRVTRNVSGSGAIVAE